jgi:hypothetical protein
MSRDTVNELDAIRELTLNELDVVSGGDVHYPDLEGEPFPWYLLPFPLPF